MGSAVEARCVFGPDPASALVYSLVPDEHAAQLSVSWLSGSLTIRAPLPLIQQWNDSDMVGMERTWRQTEDARLRVLVEKDFSCLKPRDDGEDLDTFPNPEAT